MKSTVLLLLLFNSFTLLSQSNPSTPIAMCKETLQIELNFEGFTFIDAESFDDGSYDQEYETLFFKVMRLNFDNSPDTNCHGYNNLDLTIEELTRFNDQVAFCCNDVASTSGSKVVLRVFHKDPGAGSIEPARMENGGDLFGHFSDCLTQVVVKTKKPEIFCPPISLSCDANLDPFINTVLYPEVYSSCGHSLTFQELQEEPCSDTLIRSWKLYDLENQQASCEQIITFYDHEPFDPCRFDFPESIVTNCIPDKNLFNYPDIFDEQPCDNYFFEIIHIDTLPTSGDTLFKLKIDWLLQDYCIYEPNSGAEENVDIFIDNFLDCDQLVEDGYYRYTQTITVMDSINSFDPCSIVFPENFETFCPPEYWALDEPIWEDGNCFPVSSEILYLEIDYESENACYSMKVHWAVIDKNTYDMSPGDDSNLDSIVGNQLNCDELIEDGYYRYMQEIMVNDTLSPIILTADTCVSSDFSCLIPELKLHTRAYDSCSLIQEFNWKYLIIDLNSKDTLQYAHNFEPKPYNGIQGDSILDVLESTNQASIHLNNFGIGHYKIEWWATDKCGNESKSIQHLRIVDNKFPTPFLLDILEPEFEDGKVILQAIDFDKGACNGFCLASYDNCSPEESLYFTFSDHIPNLWTEPATWQDQLIQYDKYFFDPKDGSISNYAKYLTGEAHAWIPEKNTSEMIYFKTDVKCNYSVDVYVWDQFAYNSDCDYGNYDFSSILLLTDNYEDANVIGNVKILESEKAFKGMIMHDEETGQQSISDENGDFEFSYCPGTYHLQGFSNESKTEGLSTLDLILINLAILGHIPFEDPYQQLSADLDGSGTVTTLDLFVLHGILIFDFPTIIYPSWIAISSDYSIENPDNTLEDFLQAQTEEINISLTDTLILEQNFYAIKKGDFNNTVGNGWEERKDNDMALVIQDTVISSGEQFDLHVYGKNINNFAGLQFTMDFEGLSIIKVIPGLLQNVGFNNFRQTGDKLLASITQVSTEGIDIPEDEILFTLTVTANANMKLSEGLKLNDDILRTELYTIENLDLFVHQLDLEYSSTIQTNKLNTLLKLNQNKPNPFSEDCIIEFYLPESTAYQLVIYNTNGNEIKIFSGNAKAGKNLAIIHHEELSGEGVYFYQLSTSGNSEIKKMVLLK